MFPVKYGLDSYILFRRNRVNTKQLGSSGNTPDLYLKCAWFESRLDTFLFFFGPFREMGE
jgi:hypothetical protein